MIARIIRTIHPLGTNSSEHCGILLLDKPLGLSSSAATQRVRHLLGRVRAGHVGSLDPLATGMLPICLGEATKIAGVVLDGRKCYSFTIALGARSSTGDAEGELLATAAVPQLSESQVLAAMQAFIGEQMQVPPMYSAIKRAGKPLYQLARAGITVDRPPRRIRIFELQCLGLRATGAQLDCRVICGKGTYVRTLAEDIAAALGTLGHVIALRRDWVEPFAQAAMTTMGALQELVETGSLPGLIEPLAALPGLRRIQLDGLQARRLSQGQRLTWPDSVVGTVVVLDDAGRFLGLGQTGDGLLRPKRLLVAPRPDE